MSDHQHLHDAFAEYERRADAVGAAGVAGTRPPRSSRNPMLLVAASVVLVLAVAGTVVWLVAGSGSPRRSGTPAVGGPVGSATASPSATSTQSSPSGTSTPSPSSTGGPTTSYPSDTSTPSPSSTGGPTTSYPSDPAGSATQGPEGAGPTVGPTVSADAAQMETTFRRVLGDTATVRVDQHRGVYLIGVLTATATGAQGGFDIQAVPGVAGDKATCEDPGPDSSCVISTPAGGGSLATGRETSDGGADELYYANYVFPNGATYLMHLSNRADPKGAGRTFGRMPPLTLQQVVGIVESDGWGQS